MGGGKALKKLKNQETQGRDGGSTRLFFYLPPILYYFLIPPFSFLYCVDCWYQVDSNEMD